ncbi:ABC-F family ATP-binding cassette domain-containing protein [Myroides sp. 1354]|uniref:ATP-binding cassette domain-containing protein n=1 Tax=unclassified Myroides TaxID=2642485 RepID=UPI0025780761|nr:MULTISPECIES: ATP-binding cassette domain-containing protein [unclassified Myroides]MDM1044318.1 ABC-F family ATP-binding cassette domain-containing protein [Myroides sp. R163-1]MDM1055254.1 ABC-F family ATP-binding cassette domain-containing protein [Myroides sp. 1354]MDM1068551.1 ABC-F family ATP-binding cassette domain-containing protein [Myroides sp. 1372]
MSIVIKNLSYEHADKTPLFQQLNLVLNKGEKANLIGANGTGKSTLLKLIATTPLSAIQLDGTAYYLPQINTNQTGEQTIQEALQTDKKLQALHRILQGSVNEQDYVDLDDDWAIEEHITQALQYWQLEGKDLSLPMHQLSGGQQMRVYFAYIHIHQPDILLLDEPTNHIDQATRQLLFDFLDQYKGTVLLVSHDIALLNRQGLTFEISSKGVQTYKGNYDFYKAQKQEEFASLQHRIDSISKDLRQVKTEQQKLLQKQQKAVGQHKKAEQKGGLPKIVVNTLKNAAENSSAKSTEVQAEKQHKLQGELWELKDQLEQVKPFHLSFNNSDLHTNKVLFQLKEVNYQYETAPAALWSTPWNLEIRSGERLLIEGANGRGKSTLLHLLAGNIQPTTGQVERLTSNIVYLDQFYSLLDHSKTMLEQAQIFNHNVLDEASLKNTLFQYGFRPEQWSKPVAQLSGGECLRLTICCLNLSLSSIDVLLLDEPSNNLDIFGLERLYEALREYKGTIVFISHDVNLREAIQPNRVIEM